MLRLRDVGRPRRPVGKRPANNGALPLIGPGTLGGPRGGISAVNRFLNAIVSWLRAGYPEGVPPHDYLPVLALLSRRLTSDEVKAVASQLMQRGDVDQVDIGVAITQITDELPSSDDIERVRKRLAAKGWPLDDPRDIQDAE